MLSAHLLEVIPGAAGRLARAQESLPPDDRTQDEAPPDKPAKHRLHNTHDIINVLLFTRQGDETPAIILIQYFTPDR